MGSIPAAGEEKSRCLNMLSLVSFAGMTLNKCAVLQIGTLTGAPPPPPPCRKSHPLCRLKIPTVVYMITCRLSSCKTGVYNVHLLIILETGCSSMYRKKKSFDQTGIKMNASFSSCLTEQASGSRQLSLIAYWLNLERFSCRIHIPVSSRSLG